MNPRRDIEEGNEEMSKHAKAHFEDEDQRLNEPASPEEMAQRRLLASELQALWNRPMTDEEHEFWLEFEAGFEKERLTFR